MTFPLYTLAIHLYGGLIFIGRFFSAKANDWYTLRKDQNLETKSSLKSPIWFHVSSLGELEQVIPLIKAFKAKDEHILVSFFSNSGFAHYQKYPEIDEAILLPLDTPKNAKQLVNFINPKLVIWNKNDFWFNTINEIISKDITLIFTSLAMREKHFLLHPLSSKFRKLLSRSNRLFTIDQNSYDLLAKHKFENIELGGDTRIQRVINRKKETLPNVAIDRFKGENPLLVLASVHSADIDIFKSFISKNSQYNYLIVPHDIDLSVIDDFTKQLGMNFNLMSNKVQKADCNVLILNQIGLLFDCYQYADLVYLGGGFGKGIHNLLEPTVFNKFVLMGPNCQKFGEAQLFVKNGWVQVVDSASSFAEKAKEILNEKSELKELEKFYQQYPDPTIKILEYCEAQIN